MSSSLSRWCACLVFCAGLVLVASGCGSSNSTRSFGDGGAPPNCQTLSQIKAGQTTRQWVVTALGEPKRKCDQSDGKELLTYEYAETVENHLNALFVNARETTKTQHSLYFQIKDGVVERFWQDKRVQEKRSTVN